MAMQIDSARARICDMPTTLTALSSVLTVRESPKMALLAMRSSVAVRAGSLAMTLRTALTSASSSFSVRIRACATSGMTGNLTDCKNREISAMKYLMRR